jgi:hypothetical protein
MMLSKCLYAAAAVGFVLAGALSGAQEAVSGWVPPLETRPVLMIRTGGDSGVRASGSIELREDEYAGMVITPTFHSVEDLCLGGLRVGVGAADLDQGAAAWHVEGRLVDLRQGEATIDLRWRRRINRPDLRPADSISWQQQLVLRQGDVGVLDVIRTTSQPSAGCGSFSLTYELQLAGPQALEDAAVAYDLWLVQQDADGERVTDRFQVTAKQGQKVDYFFRPIPYAADGHRSDTSAAAVLMNVSGAIRGRLRTDGRIDLTVDGSRWFTDAARAAGVGNQGRTMITVKPGETIEVSTNLPMGNLGTLGDLNQVFGKHRTAVRVTARRLW